jgi:type II secretory pathway component GspD/PulD (secretin)
MHARALVTALATLALLVAPLSTPAAQADEKLRLILEDETEMEDFLRQVARMTNSQFIWNPADKNIRGKKIIGGIHFEGSRERLLEVVRALLTFYEIVMIPVGPRDYEVTLIMDARMTSSILKLKPEYVVLTDENLADYEHADGKFITTTIQVEHMTNLRNARNALTRVVTGQNIGSVTEVTNANTFVVTDFAPNVVSVYRLLEQMDRPSANASTTGGSTRAITIQHAEAEAIAAVLNRHFAGAPAPEDKRAVAQPPLSAPRITADERTNQVLVSGTDAQIAKVEAALGLLDVLVPTSKQEAHVVELEHVPAQEAAVALNMIMRGNELWRGGGAAPNVVALARKNALLISASQQAFEEIKALIARMDVPEEAADGKR